MPDWKKYLRDKLSLPLMEGHRDERVITGGVALILGMEVNPADPASMEVTILMEDSPS